MKIALLGSAPSSVQLAPYHDKTWTEARQGIPVSPFQLEPWVDDKWEIWGVSPGAFVHAQRANRWFEVHRWEPGQPWFQPAYIQFLRDFKGPVYTGGVIPEIRNHVVYPIERVERRFSPYFLHSSLSLMLAMAILEIEDDRKRPRQSDTVRLKPEHRKGTKAGERELNLVSVSPLGSVRVSWLDRRGKPTFEWLDPDHLEVIRRGEFRELDTIGLWGVDMASNEEYGDQRSGCHFFILEALRAGIEIYVPPESCLLRPKPFYGLSEWSHDYIKATSKAREYNQRIQHYQSVLQDAQQNLGHLQGASGDLKYFVDTWTSPYGLPSGVRIKHDPGTGLGGGITMPRPQTAYIEHPPATSGPLELVDVAESAGSDAQPGEEGKATTARKLHYGGKAGGGKSFRAGVAVGLSTRTKSILRLATPKAKPKKKAARRR